MSTPPSPSSAPTTPLPPTRTMGCDFEEQTELVRRDDEDEHTLRGPMIEEAPPPVAATEPTRVSLEREPSAPRTADARPKPPYLVLALGAAGAALGILGAFFLS